MKTGPGRTAQQGTHQAGARREKQGEWLGLSSGGTAGSARVVRIGQCLYWPVEGTCSALGEETRGAQVRGPAGKETCGVGAV